MAQCAEQLLQREREQGWSCPKEGVAETRVRIRTHNHRQTITHPTNNTVTQRHQGC